MKRRYKARLNVQQSPWLLIGIPVLSVIAGSMTTLLPIIANLPLLPPFGLMILLGWRMLRPHLWPIWCGVPFGIIDDLFSGQPLGSAVFIWSVILITVDIIEQRHWLRNFWQGWLIASALLIFALWGGLVINNIIPYAFENATPRNVPMIVLVPQLILTLAIYPLILRLILILDQMRIRR